jgi:murein DD-endopeptidase MepM/ murein hydrolase activator NlpD
MKKFFLMVLLIYIWLPALTSASGLPTLSVSPIVPVQGEPMKIQIEGAELDSIKNLSFDGMSVPILKYLQKPVGFVGIDLTRKPGVYKFDLELKDGTRISHWLYIGERFKIKAPLGIPQKLGGNTPAAATSLVSNLSRENAVLNSLQTESKALWDKNFMFPLESIFITDPYGYSRTTGQYNIAHKGTDFRAKEGTKVFAMNSGFVRLAKKFEVYGNTVVIDHGLGMMTFYMHLSETLVNQGATVEIGSLIGKSGSTGYAENPHLHLSIKLNNTSIDPMKFMEFFK